MSQGSRPAQGRLPLECPRAAAYAVAAVCVSLLALASARAEVRLPEATTAGVALALAVGVAFVFAGALTVADPLPRALLSATGLAWLVASLEPTAQRLHQGLLLVALLTLASGRLRGAGDKAVAVAAGAVALLLVPQLVVVVLFAAVTARAMSQARGDPAQWYTGAAAAAVATVLGSAWLLAWRTPESFRPEVALVAYEVLLLMVAVGAPAAVAASRLYRTRLADRVLASGPPAGLDGLAQVLRSVLHDPSLAVRRPGEVTSTLAKPPWRLDVRDGRMLLAVVEHRVSALGDPLAAEAAASAVRLVALNDLRHDELRAELARLTAARSRIVTTRDRQRTDIAGRLRSDVVLPLRGATEDLSAVAGSLPDADSTAVLDVVIGELRATMRDVLDLVDGVPPVELGEGRLVAAVTDLARRTPMRVEVLVEGDVRADGDDEGVLFYVCSEALANAAKHSAAAHVTVRLRATDDTLELGVGDDGRGGADRTGSGLQGLADRLAGHGGQLEVRSPRGGGTTVRAMMPNRSAPTASG